VHRTSRTVRLTPFGEQFLRDVRPAFEQLSGVLERANAAARSLEGTLRLGLLSGPVGGPQLVEILHTVETRHPECAIEVVQISWDDPLGPLRDNGVDLMASWLPLEQPDLVIGPVLTSQPRVLAVAHHHPLAQRESIDVEELADHEHVRFDNWPKELHEAVLPSETLGDVRSQPRGSPPGHARSSTSGFVSPGASSPSRPSRRRLTTWASSTSSSFRSPGCRRFAARWCGAVRRAIRSSARSVTRPATSSSPIAA
jgi:DNA-binding transcriptional LysR family regulator